MAKFIKFYLGGKAFGIDILLVQEILLAGEIMIFPIPKAPDYLSGIINLRGMLVPLVDFRIKMDQPARPVTEKTRIIILKIKKGQTVGALVDELANVIEAPEDKIEPPPSDSANAYGKISGIYKEKESLMELINLDSAIYSQDNMQDRRRA